VSPKVSSCKVSHHRHWGLIMWHHKHYRPRH